MQEQQAHRKAIAALREALAKQQATELVAIEYWLQDTMESGRWVTTDNMAKATAEKMLSGEYGDVYPQGRIVEPSPPASKPWVGMTEDEISKLMTDAARYRKLAAMERELVEPITIWHYLRNPYDLENARAIEAAHGIKENT